MYAIRKWQGGSRIILAIGVLHRANVTHDYWMLCIYFLEQ